MTQPEQPDTMTRDQVAAHCGIAPSAVSSTMIRWDVPAVGRQPGRGGQSLYSRAAVLAAHASAPGRGARTDTVHGYYVGKARKAFAAAGGDPDLSGELAAWAEQQMAKAREDRPQGAVVAQDGRVLAATFHSGNATYVNNEGRAKYGLMPNELGLAVSQIAKAEGMPVVHIKLSLFTGPRVNA